MFPFFQPPQRPPPQQSQPVANVAPLSSVSATPSSSPASPSPAAPPSPAPPPPLPSAEPVPSWLLALLYGAAATVVLLLAGYRLYVYCWEEAAMDGYEIIVREPSGPGMAAQGAAYASGQQQQAVARSVSLMSPLRLTGPAVLYPPKQQTPPGSSASSPLSSSYPVQPSYISTDEEEEAAAAEKELKQVWSV